MFVVLSQITTCCLPGNLLAGVLAHTSSLSVNFLLLHKYITICQERAEEGLVARKGREVGAGRKGLSNGPGYVAIN